MVFELIAARHKALSPIPIACAIVLATVSLAVAPLSSRAQDELVIGFASKSDSNPYFVAMREAAARRADELGVGFLSCSSQSEFDVEGQVVCVESLIAAGASGILLTPAEPTSVVTDVIGRARESGLPVVALDTLTALPDAVDATLATDGFQAGELIGRWTEAMLRTVPGGRRIVLLGRAEDLGHERTLGFAAGLGIDPTDLMFIEAIGGDPQAVRQAVESLLMADPGIEAVFTINEPIATAATDAIATLGRTDELLVVSAGGGCAGVQQVKEGAISAMAMPMPQLTGQQGVETIVEYFASGHLPAPSDGLGFTNVGVVVITDTPVDGVASQGSAWGEENCWG